MDENQFIDLWNNKDVDLSRERVNVLLKQLLYRINALDYERTIQIKRRKRIRFSYVAACFIAVPLLLCSITFLIKSETKEVYISNLKYYAPIGQSKTIILPDSTLAILNSGSVLITPEKYPTGKRIVYLIGEAYFKVAKNKNKLFIVNTQYMTIEALGTEFVVMSYPQDNNTRTTLVEGSVLISVSNSENRIKSVILQPSQQSNYNLSMPDISISEVNTSVYTSWMNKNLIFDNTPFEDVITRLEVQSGKAIEYDKRIRKYRISAKFIRNESVEEILKLLCQITYSEYMILDENTYGIR